LDRVWGARAYYLAATLLIVSALIIPALGLQSTSSLQSYGTIIYPTEFMYGVCAHPSTLTERDFQEAKTLGVKYLRMDFNWPDIETSRGVFEWSKYDQFVQWGKQYGIEIIPILLMTPWWLYSSPGTDFAIPPSGAAFDDFVSEFGKFTYAVVDHYKGSINYFEIWNEPNNLGSWTDPEATIVGDHVFGKAVTKYVTLLKSAYLQAKMANPNCLIISGGISNCERYLQEMYDNGAKGYFDLFGSHPYFAHSPTKNYDVDYINPDEPEWTFPAIQYMRNIMIANGDEAKDILITELGVDDWPGGPEGPTTQAMQADRLTRIFEKTIAEYPYVEGIMWYQLKDTHEAFSSVPVTIANWGLFRMNGSWDPDYPNVVDYTPRLMYYAYKQLISTHPT